MDANSNKSVVVEKSLSGIDGWLSFGTVALGVSAVGYLWTFFMAISGMVGGVEGIDLAIAIETLIFSLGLVFLFGFTLFLLVNRKKLAVMWAYITLGVLALYATVMSFTLMFNTTEDCRGSYSVWEENSRRSCETVGLPADQIVALVGSIFVAWAAAMLIAYYFKKSARVKAALTE